MEDSNLREFSKCQICVISVDVGFTTIDCVLVVGYWTGLLSNSWWCVLSMFLKTSGRVAQLPALVSLIGILYQEFVSLCYGTLVLPENSLF